MTANPDTGRALAPLRRPAVLVPLVAALCLIPLLVTPVLPLIDFYAHVARYYVLALDGVETGFGASYAAEWTLLPNLGLDVIGTALMTLVPPLLGAKLLGALIVLAPFLGALSLARVLHGRVAPVNVALAGLMSYSFILSWGFANFILGIGLALWALGLWIGQTGRPVLQLAVGIVAGLVIMLVHGLVFGLWGLLLFTVEVMLIREAGPMPVTRILWRISRLGILAVGPVILFLATQTAGAEGGVTKAFSNLAGHADRGALWQRLADEVWKRLDSILRVAESTWPVADRLFGLLLWGALALAFLTGALRLDRRLWIAVGLMVVLVGIMPPNLFGVGHLDERMPLLLLGLIAAGVTAGRAGRRVAPLFGGLFALHLGMVTAGWAQMGSSYRAFLDAAARLEPGGMAQAVFAPAMQDRDASRACKPLLFLLLLQNGTAVSTFSNPTQQPLRIVGPLQTAIDAARDAAPGDDPVDAAGRAGFDLAVLCDSDPIHPGDAARLVARHDDWALFRTSAP